MRTIALLSPNKSSVSETFIQAHKRLLRARIIYYYNGALPHCCEGQGPLHGGRLDAVLKKLRRSGDMSLAEDMLLRSFARNGVEKVYAEYGPTGAAVLNVCIKAGLPLIVHFHGYDISVRSVVNRYRDQYARMFDYAEAIVAVSKCMITALVELGADRSKIVYTPCAPQDVFFLVNPRLAEPVFAAAGRFVDKKAPYYTVLAFAKLLRTHPGARLYFAGEGPLLNSCKNIARHLGCDNAIVFPGAVDSPALQKRLTAELTCTGGNAEACTVTIVPGTDVWGQVSRTHNRGDTWLNQKMVCQPDCSRAGHQERNYAHRCGTWHASEKCPWKTPGNRGMHVQASCAARQMSAEHSGYGPPGACVALCYYRR